jgi:hypothetical protein
MKNYLLGIISATAIFSVIAFTNSSNKTNELNKEWIVGPRYLTLQEGVSKEEARAFFENEYLEIYNELPGFNASVGIVDPNRGKGRGDFIMIYTWDSKWTRDYYFPKAGERNDQVKEAIEKHQDTYDKLFGKYFIKDEYYYEAYLMFASAK